MLRLGVISELGTGENLGFCRVDFDESNVVSAWISLPSSGTQERQTKIWQPIAVGSQVACLMDEDCEQGLVVGVVWSNKDLPPDFASESTVGIQFADGAKLFYDSENKKLYFDAPESEINIICKKINITGDVDVTGRIDASVQVAVGAIGLTTHLHPTPMGVSGAPVAGAPTP